MFALSFSDLCQIVVNAIHYWSMRAVIEVSHMPWSFVRNSDWTVDKVSSCVLLKVET